MKEEYKARYKYEKNVLKRIALDVNKELEYIPFKELCDNKGIAVSGFIRQLMKESIDYDGITIADIMATDQFKELQAITERNGTNIKELLNKALITYIDKHKQD